jgi:outer membrane protein TolC
VENVLFLKDAVNAGVGLSYSPSSIWKAGTKVAHAKARLAEVAAGQAMLEDGIRMETAQAYENYLLAKKKIEVYAVAVAQSTENYRIVRNKYNNSLATTTDLLDADVAQLQAQLNFAFARADAAVSYKKLLQTAGLLSAERPDQN